MLNLRPKVPTKLRLSETVYLEEISESLRQDGIECVPEIYWR